LYGATDIPAYAVPARAADYAGLPPTCSFVGSVEPFRDETATYIENLRKAQVPAEFRIFDGCFHAFDLVCGKSKVAEEATTFLMKNYRYAVENYYAAQPKESGFQR
jgi:acetyl esterase/lipase